MVAAGLVVVGALAVYAFRHSDPMAVKKVENPVKAKKNLATLVSDPNLFQESQKIQTPEPAVSAIPGLVQPVTSLPAVPKIVKPVVRPMPVVFSKSPSVQSSLVRKSYKI